MGKQYNKEVKRRRRKQLLKRRKEAERSTRATPGSGRSAEKVDAKKKPAAKKPAAKKAPEAAPAAE
jgi:hypothetical protein